MPSKKNKCRRIGDVFNEAQVSLVNHPKLLRELSVMQKADCELFASGVTNILDHILLAPVNKSSDQNIGRVIQFLGTFCKSHQNGDNALSLSLIGFLLNKCNAKDKNVRYRACQLLGTLMDTLHETENENDDSGAAYDRIIEVMKQRLYDTFPSVREMAVLALYRLHDPHDPDDDVTQALLLSMASDLSPDVRKMILSKLRMSRVTLSHLLRMARDINKDVRHQAYSVIKQSVQLTNLKIPERVQLLKQGLVDREEKVQKVARELCITWLKFMNYDPVLFLAQLDVEMHLDELAEIIQVVIEYLRTRRKLHRVGAAEGKEEKDEEPAAPVTQTEMVGPDYTFDRDLKAVTAESVVYWKVVCTNLAKEKNEAQLEEQLGCLSDFCDFLSRIFFKSAQEVADEESRYNPTFVCSQVLSMCPLFDFGDEAGRRKLTVVLTQILSVFDIEHPDQYIKPMIAAWRCIHRDSLPNFIGSVQSAIVTLRSGDPNADAADIDLTVEEQNLSRASKQKRLTELKFLLRSQAWDVNSGERNNIVCEIKQLAFALHKDKAIWQRSLFLIIECLENLPRCRQTIVPDSLSRVILAACQQQDNAAVFELAVHALGLLCLTNLVVVPTHLPIFHQALHYPTKKVRQIALKSVFDIYMIWGPAHLEEHVRRLSVPENPFVSPTFSTLPTPTGREDETPDPEKGLHILREIEATLFEYLAYGEPAVPIQLPVQVDSDLVEEADRTRCRMELQTDAAEGFAKLLSCNKWKQRPAQVLAQLLLNYHNPDLVVLGDGDDDENGAAVDVADDESVTASQAEQELTDSLTCRSTPMRQYLQMFFTAYGSSSALRQQIFSTAGFIALRHLVRNHYYALPVARQCPRQNSRPRPEVKTALLSEFLNWWVSCTDCSKLPTCPPKPDAGNDEAKLKRMQFLIDNSLHEILAVDVLLETLADGRETYRRYLKLLGLINIHCTNKVELLAYLQHLCNKVLEDKGIDRLSQASVSKFFAKLQSKANETALNGFNKNPIAHKILDDGTIQCSEEAVDQMNEAIEQHMQQRNQYLTEFIGEVAKEDGGAKKKTGLATKRPRTWAVDEEEDENEVENQKDENEEAASSVEPVVTVLGKRGARGGAGRGRSGRGGRGLDAEASVPSKSPRKGLATKSKANAQLASKPARPGMSGKRTSHEDDSGSDIERVMRYSGRHRAAASAKQTSLNEVDVEGEAGGDELEGDDDEASQHLIDDSQE